MLKIRWSVAIPAAFLALTGPVAAQERPPEPQTPPAAEETTPAQETATPPAEAPPAEAPPDAGDEMTVDVLAGGQFLRLTGDRPIHFFEYRDVPRGALVDRLGLRWARPGSPWLFDLDARRALRADERYVLTLGRPGSFKVHLFFDRLPHNLYEDATWLLQGDRGVFTFENRFRQLLETAATDPLAPEPLAVVVPSVLASTARRIDIGFERKKGGFATSFPLVGSVALHLEGTSERWQGNRRIATGTYIRRQAIAGEPGTGPGFFDRERVEPRGLELPEPIDYRVHEFGASASVRFRRGYAIAGGHVSTFDNRVSTLFWNNPFEASPSATSSTTGLNPGVEQEPPAPVGIQNNRGRAANNALDLWPDNRHFNAFVRAGFDLPMRTRVSAHVSLGQFDQDEAFLPYTQNEAVLFGPGPDTVYGTADDVFAIDAPLPARDLAGDIRTLRTDLLVTSRPLDPLTLRAGFRRYDLENRSRHLVFPGYVAAGESYFRAGIGQRIDGVRALFNEPPEFTRTTWFAGAAWRFGHVASVGLDYVRTAWDYETRAVDETTEDAWTLHAALHPIDLVDVHLKATHADRDFEGLYNVGLETSRIRQYDLWTRERRVYEASVDVMPGEAWTAGVGYSWRRDEFPGVVPEAWAPSASNPFPSFPYGLNESKNTSAFATLGYGVSDFSVSATIGHDTDLWESLQVTKTSLTADAIQYDPQNRWVRRQDDTVDWANFSLDGRAGERLRYGADVTVSWYEGDLETFNLETPTVNSAVAYDYPEFKTRLLSVRLSGLWTLTPHLDLAVSYWYEPFRLDDFMWDNMAPYMQGRIVETGSAPDVLRPSNVSRFLWLDARYTDYTAHVLSTMLSIHF